MTRLARTVALFCPATDSLFLPWNPSASASRPGRLLPGGLAGERDSASPPRRTVHRGASPPHRRESSQLLRLRSEGPLTTVGLILADRGHDPRPQRRGQAWDNGSSQAVEEVRPIGTRSETAKNLRVGDAVAFCDTRSSLNKRNRLFHQCGVLATSLISEMWNPGNAAGFQPA
jgi:hypothetical protein